MLLSTQRPRVPFLVKVPQRLVLATVTELPGMFGKNEDCRPHSESIGGKRQELFCLIKCFLFEKLL